MIPNEDQTAFVLEIPILKTYINRHKEHAHKQLAILALVLQVKHYHLIDNSVKTQNAV